MTRPMSEEELAPCPFCGARATHHEIEDQDDDNFGGHFITCTNPVCGASTNLRFASGDDPRPLLAEQWNRRTPSPACREMMRALEAIKLACDARGHNPAVFHAAAVNTVERIATKALSAARAAGIKEE